MDGNTGTLMLLLEALKSNKGQFFFLFHLLYLTRRWHLEIMNFNFCHSQKKKKKNYQRTCLKYFIFKHYFQIIQEGLISCYLSKPMLFFFIVKAQCVEKNWPWFCLRSSQGWGVSKQHAYQLRNCWKTHGETTQRFNLANTLGYIMPYTGCGKVKFPP